MSEREQQPHLPSSTQRLWRKKPVVIEAWKFDPSRPVHEVPGWLSLNAVRTNAIGKMILPINTLEGTMVAAEGDWIIRGVKGEIYPCKPDIFEATYEPA